WIAWGVISIWFLYRIVRGWMNLNANAPMPG
ncbi:MAG: putative rane protein, partial [Proteobacteria bacterium]|nr:putative rane protein [Pseudomonadota bacterium]